MNQIVLPFDYCMDNRSAYVHAIKLSRLLAAKLVLIHSVPDNMARRQEWLKIEDELIGLRGNYLQNFADDQYDLELKHELITGTRSLSKLALENIRKNKASLIVMTLPKGESEHNRSFGKTIRTIVSDISVPVMFIPEAIEYQIPQKICLSTYLADARSVLKVETISKWLKEYFKNPVSLLNITTSQIRSDNQLLHNLSRSIPSDFIKSIAHYEGTDFMSGIRHGLSRKNPDLQVILGNKDVIVDSLLNENYTNSVALSANIPVLVVPNSTDVKISELFITSN